MMVTVLRCWWQKHHRHPKVVTKKCFPTHSVTGPVLVSVKSCFLLLGWQLGLCFFYRTIQNCKIWLLLWSLYLVFLLSTKFGCCSKQYFDFKLSWFHLNFIKIVNFMKKYSYSKCSEMKSRLSTTLSRLNWWKIISPPASDLSAFSKFVSPRYTTKSVIAWYFQIFNQT